MPSVALAFAALAFASPGVAQQAAQADDVAAEAPKPKVSAEGPASTGRPDFVTAPVTAETAVAAVEECAWQLRNGAFDHQRLTDAGWVNAIHTEDGTLQGFRHRDNMILLSTNDGADRSDTCTVMAPTGRGMVIDEIRSALAAHFGARPSREGDQSLWQLDDLRIVLRPMGPVGVTVEMSPRS